ncbi:MAG: DUF58 domain-containing protein [Actinomycetota bacterium]
MLTGRGVAVLAAGLTLWIAARIMGSQDLHIVAVGLVVLGGLAAGGVRFLRQTVEANRRLSLSRAFPGARVRVELEVRNVGRSRTGVLLLEDRLPAGLGRAARAVLGGIPPRGKQTVSYSVQCRSRGRFRIGPLTAYVTDPFGLARTTIALPGQDDLIVYPEVEELEPPHSASAGGGPGTSRARHLLRAGEDFYTMRQYEVGDDLRRIHWPSVAKTGELMIRQHEAARRAAATVFLDTRARILPAGDPFERAVSAAASIAAAYTRAGYALRFSTPDLAPGTMGVDDILETLALVEHSDARLLSPALLRLRDAAGAYAALAVVTHVPEPAELPALIRGAAGYGPKLAVLVEPRDSSKLDPEAWEEAELRKSGARLALVRAGWNVLNIGPTGRLRDVWHLRGKRPARIATGS